MFAITSCRRAVPAQVALNSCPRRTTTLNTISAATAERKRSTAARCNKSEQQPQFNVLEWFVEQSEKPVFLLVQAALGLGFLAVLDGGLSGDWLKYDLIDQKMQADLTQAAWVGLVAHGGIGAYAARDCVQSAEAEQGRSATPVQVAFATVRGFLVGFMELARVVATQRVREMPK